MRKSPATLNLHFLHDNAVSESMRSSAAPSAGALFSHVRGAFVGGAPGSSLQENTIVNFEK